jgi:hypothetical protein
MRLPRLSRLLYRLAPDTRINHAPAGVASRGPVLLLNLKISRGPQEFGAASENSRYSVGSMPACVITLPHSVRSSAKNF